MKKVLNFIMVIIMMITMNFMNISFFGNAVENPILNQETIDYESEYDDTIYTDSERDVKTGYLLRENFQRGFKSMGGWNRVNFSMPSSGDVSVIEKSVKNLETSMSKEFAPQSEEIVVEFKTILSKEVTRATIAIEGKKNNVALKSILIEIRNNEMKYVDAQGNKTLVSVLSLGNWTGFKLVCNTQTNTLDIFINGVLKIADVTYTKETDVLNGIFFGIDASGTGAYQLGTIYIYKGYDVYEDLISAGTGSQFDITRDYNYLSYARASYVGGANQNNPELTALGVDHNDNTYWEHKSTVDAHMASYVVEYNNTVTPINKVIVKFASAYKGELYVGYQLSSSGWARTDNSIYPIYLDVAAGYVLEKEFPVVYAIAVSLDFRKKVEGDISGNIIKIASFEAYCTENIGGEIPSFPSDWSNYNQGGTAKAAAYYGYSAGYEYNAFQLNDTSTSDKTGIYKQFNRSGSLRADFKFMAEPDMDGTYTFIKHQSGRSFGIATDINKMYFKVTDEQGNTEYQTELFEFQRKIWYSVQFVYNIDTNDVKISTNGWSPVENQTVSETFAIGSFVQFGSESENFATGIYYVDDIRIQQKPVDTTVPVPVPLDTGDTMLTMQACTLWREGTHWGWTMIDREATYNRKPILGWYDEGTQEVTDWEIKVAAEHGINNLMYCWYRLDTGSGPIMKSRLADQMWEGYFNSAYREMLNFSVMMCNGPGMASWYSYDDIINNLMPYYIEVFFKNPNYSKTPDGKPIFYIYDYNLLFSQCGDINNDGKADYLDIIKLFAEMEQMCIEAGFPGIHIGTEYRGNSSAVVQQIEKCGYDYIFGYTWHPTAYNMTNDEVLAMTKNMMLSQRSALKPNSGTQIIPNLSKSWDSSGWSYLYSNKSASYMYDLEHYRQLAVWIKEVFKPAEIGGMKMVMLDNWNEYSEGHWLFPTYGTPAYKGGQYTYGYLDVLREVFGIGDYNQDHNDIMPLEEGWGPYDLWYPDGWNSVNDNYWNTFGSPVDNSIKNNIIADYVIGLNNDGGNTNYLAQGINETSSIVVTSTDSARVIILKETLAEAFTLNKTIEIKMLNGNVIIPFAALSALDKTKNLDIVLSRMIDTSSVANKIKTAGGNDWGLYKATAYNFKIMQNGFQISLNEGIIVNIASQNANDAAIIGSSAVRQNLQAVLNTFSITVATGCEIALVVQY